MNSPASFERNVFLKLKCSTGNINPFTTFKQSGWKCYKTIGSYVSCVFIEIWSTWEVWRALKKLELLSATPWATLTHLSCSPNFLEIWSTWEVWRALKKLELLSAMPQATLTHLLCSPNFLHASYLDEHMLTYEPIVKLNILGDKNSSWIKQSAYLKIRQ